MANPCHNPSASRKGPWPILRWRWIGALAGLLLVSCSSLGYYGQAVRGQVGILLARRNIDRLVEDPATAEPLRARLAFVREVRHFAVTELGLPDNGSYGSYVELPPKPDGGRRSAVVWNVMAAPELSTAPLTWCFPIAGCVAYRGYFREKRARRFADRLTTKGYDVAVGGAAAYSTLGWFKDPVLSTVIDYPEPQLAALLFHELAHQELYLPGDTAFNESFASMVEIEGLRRWLAAAGRPAAELEAYGERLARQEELSELLLDFRARLQEAYEEPGSEATKRRRKAELFDALRATYRDLRHGWGLPPTTDDRWLAPDLNNADLVSVGSYRSLVPGFRRLLEKAGNDLPAFYQSCRELSELPAEVRQQRLSADSDP